MIDFCKEVQKNLNLLRGEEYAKYFVEKKIEFFLAYQNGLITSCFHGIEFFDHIIEYADKPDLLLKGLNLKKEKYNMNFVQILKNNSK